MFAGMLEITEERDVDDFFICLILQETFKGSNLTKEGTLSKKGMKRAVMNT